MKFKAVAKVAGIEKLVSKKTGKPFGIFYVNSVSSDGTPSFIQEQIFCFDSKVLEASDKLAGKLVCLDITTKDAVINGLEVLEDE